MSPIFHAKYETLLHNSCSVGSDCPRQCDADLLGCRWWVWSPTFTLCRSKVPTKNLCESPWSRRKRDREQQALIQPSEPCSFCAIVLSRAGIIGGPAAITRKSIASESSLIRFRQK